MIKTKTEVFVPIDGTVCLCRDGPMREVRGLDWSTADGLERLYELPFRSLLIRADDTALLQSEGLTAELKLEVPLAPDLTPSLTAVYDSHAYEITRIDGAGRQAYLYLKRLVPTGRAEMVSTEVTYDQYGQSKRVETKFEVFCRETRYYFDSGSPRLALNVRTADWAGAKNVDFGGTRFSVTGSVTNGAWTELTCESQREDKEAAWLKQ